MTAGDNAREIVLAYVQALNQDQFEEARRWVSDDLSFQGVLGSRNGAEAYFNDMRSMRLRYTVKKVFSDEQDVCLWYDVTISGRTVLTCGWYHVEQGKIRSLRVIFDPRPILEQKAA